MSHHYAAVALASEKRRTGRSSLRIRADAFISVTFSANSRVQRHPIACALFKTALPLFCRSSSPASLSALSPRELELARVGVMRHWSPIFHAHPYSPTCLTSRRPTLSPNPQICFTHCCALSNFRRSLLAH
ncbi:hypothetical protein TRVL_09065 [Trypanosoma vivax]|nr:hypothetical protein TRVL_09065 [Trypanosoma vivax]